jgi:hypothetical protein
VKGCLGDLLPISPGAPALTSFLDPGAPPRNPPGSPGAPPGSPGAPPGSPGAPPGSPGAKAPPSPPDVGDTLTSRSRPTIEFPPQSVMVFGETLLLT